MVRLLYSSASSVVTGTRINPAATNLLSEALSLEYVLTKLLPSNGIFRVVV
jgi:hypothetical protein